MRYLYDRIVLICAVVGCILEIAVLLIYGMSVANIKTLVY